MTIILVGNLLTLVKRRKESPHNPPRVSIVIPARNEASNLRRLLPMLASQSYPDVEVIVYDDESTDRTWEVIQQHQGGRIIGIRGGPLPDGWIGKCYALDQAAEQASGELLLFLDADVILADDHAIERLVSEFSTLPPFRALTIMPGLHPSGGRLLVSLIPNSILLSIPWFVTRHIRIPSMAMLNGQCWLIDSEDYRSLRPHQAHRSEILEDVAIARDLVRAGMRIHIVATKGEIDVRMYETIDEAWRGFRKNTYLLFGGTPLRFVLFQIPFVFLFLLAPIIEPFLLLWLIALKYGTDRVAGFKALVSILAPLSYVMAFLLDWDSAWHHWRGQVRWKGRSVS
jgi:glycosyltransferase involved in cell wall biosynthesis